MMEYFLYILLNVSGKLEILHNAFSRKYPTCNKYRIFSSTKFHLRQFGAGEEERPIKHIDRNIIVKQYLSDRCASYV